MQGDHPQPTWAGVVNYYLYGGSRRDDALESWPVNVDFGDDILDQFPSERVNALQHRLFLHCAVRYMSSMGIKQFIDVGSGLVGPYSTHRVLETAYQEQGRRSDARTCYVDNDSTAVARGTVFFDETRRRPQPRFRPRPNIVIEGDLRRPDELLTEIGYEELINFDEPVGLIVTGTMQLEQRNRQGQEVGPDALRHFADQMAPGSYLALSHTTNESRIPGDGDTVAVLEDIQYAYNSTSIGAVAWRSRAEIESLAGDYRPVEGGWAPAELWGQNHTGAGAPRILPPPASYPLVWAGVGRKE